MLMACLAIKLSNCGSAGESMSVRKLVQKVIGTERVEKAVFLCQQKISDH